MYQMNPQVLHWAFWIVATIVLIMIGVLLVDFVEWAAGHLPSNMAARECTQCGKSIPIGETLYYCDYPKKLCKSCFEEAYVTKQD